MILEKSRGEGLILLVYKSNIANTAHHPFIPSVKPRHFLSLFATLGRKPHNLSMFLSLLMAFIMQGQPWSLVIQQSEYTQRMGASLLCLGLVARTSCSPSLMDIVLPKMFKLSSPTPPKTQSKFVTLQCHFLGCFLSFPARHITRLTNYHSIIWLLLSLPVLNYYLHDVHIVESIYWYYFSHITIFRNKSLQSDARKI